VSHSSAGHVNAAHFAGSRGHWASHAASAHASHNWSRSHGNYSHVTRNNLHATHTAGINSNTKNNGKLNHTNLNHANALATNQGKNLNSHVTPLKHAADPHNFGVRRAYANKAAFQPFWHDGWHNAWWHRNNSRSGRTARPISRSRRRAGSTRCMTASRRLSMASTPSVRRFRASTIR